MISLDVICYMYPYRVGRKNSLDLSKLISFELEQDKRLLGANVYTRPLLERDDVPMPEYIQRVHDTKATENFIQGFIRHTNRYVKND